jgi:hypothetical protein
MTLHHATRSAPLDSAAKHDDGRQGVDAVEEAAREHPSLVRAARVGWLAKGIVYGIVGVLAFKIATDSGSTAPAPGDAEASQSGAIAEIAQSSAGKLALWAVAIGLAIYVLWRIMSILLPARSSAKVWVTRAGYAISAITYTFLALSAVSIARHASTGSESENSRIETFTRDLMERTAGRWMVGLLGVILVGIGLAFAYRAVTADFESELAGGVGPIERRHLVRLGQVGWLGRAAMMGLIGAFLIRAAVLFDPAEAEGLDGALRRVVDESWGPFAVGCVGVGLVLYGLYCVLSAPVQRLKSAS